MLGLDDVVLEVRIEAVFVELIKVGRIEDCHIDITGAEQIIDQNLFAISAEFVQWPHLFGWAQRAVKRVEAFDPALPVFAFPILGAGVPKCMWPSITKMSCPLCWYMRPSRVCLPQWPVSIEM